VKFGARHVSIQINLGGCSGCWKQKLIVPAIHLSIILDFANRKPGARPHFIVNQNPAKLPNL
jgi:hypothetical protein